MTPRKDAPDVDQLARSMLLLHGVHDDDDHADGEASSGRGTWSKAPDFRRRPRRGAARGHRAGPRALSDVGSGVGRLPVLPRGGRREEARARAHVGAVEQRGDQRCAYFADIRASGGDPARARSPARSSQTASNTLSPKAAWRRCRRRRPPATAEPYPDIRYAGRISGILDGWQTARSQDARTGSRAARPRRRGHHPSR